MQLSFKIGDIKHDETNLFLSKIKIGLDIHILYNR